MVRQIASPSKYVVRGSSDEGSDEEDDGDHRRHGAKPATGDSDASSPPDLGSDSEEEAASTPLKKRKPGAKTLKSSKRKTTPRGKISPQKTPASKRKFGRSRSPARSSGRTPQKAVKYTYDSDSEDDDDAPEGNVLSYSSRSRGRVGVGPSAPLCCPFGEGVFFWGGGVTWRCSWGKGVARPT